MLSVISVVMTGVGLPEYRFCPVCSAQLGHLVPPGDEQERLVCSGCGFVFYQNSKPCAAALVAREGKVLLARRGIEPFKDWWDLPGGFLELGEHPEAAVVRELLEETGLAVRPTALLGIYMDWYREPSEATLVLTYLVDIVAGEPRPASDVADLAWFSPDDLPERIAFTCNRAALDDWRKRLP